MQRCDDGRVSEVMKEFLEEVGSTIKRFFKVSLEKKTQRKTYNMLKILQYFISSNKLLLHGTYTCIYRRRV